MPITELYVRKEKALKLRPNYKLVTPIHFPDRSCFPIFYSALPKADVTPIITGSKVAKQD